MAHRFRFIGDKQGDGLWHLEGEEAYHVAKVLRLDEGTAVEVTDGRGYEAFGTLQSISPSAVLIAASMERHIAPAAAPFVFAVGALKPGSIDDILPALTELGVDEVWVFQQEESAKSRLGDKAAARWEKIVAQSVKQCKRAWRPSVRTFPSIEAMIAEGEARIDRDTAGGALKVVLSAGTVTTLATLVAQCSTLPMIVVAGGEKGLVAAEEQALAAAGYRNATLGPYVLRAVTAAVAAAAVVSSLRC